MPPATHHFLAKGNPNLTNPPPPPRVGKRWNSWNFEDCFSAVFVIRRRQQRKTWELKLLLLRLLEGIFELDPAGAAKV